MLAIALAAAAALPPPPSGDERTEILAAANALLRALDQGTAAELEALVDPAGRIVVVNRSKSSETIRTLPMRQFIAELPGNKDRLAERIGAPTLLQRGGLAQVWAPYTFWVNGKVSHCGIDNFTLVRRDGRWIVSDLSYTREAVSECAALGAPTEPE